MKSNCLTMYQQLERVTLMLTSLYIYIYKWILTKFLGMESLSQLWLLTSWNLYLDYLFANSNTVTYCMNLVHYLIVPILSFFIYKYIIKSCCEEILWIHYIIHHGLSYVITSIQTLLSFYYYYFAYLFGKYCFFLCGIY